ncbi:MAG: PQQ-binding-like beta-propeller repeat protein [Syntrophomonadaceae bacterium]|nr:PQQ-binding-like beta-propeller repeat protein [Syntrophomonadaceae bacterium]
MKRLLIVLMIFLFIFPLMAQAAPKLEIYNHPSETRQKGQIIWKLSGLGKPSEPLILVPDDKLIILAGSKMLCINLQGNLLWETKVGNGKMGNPIVTENGSIFTAGKGMVVETKINGARGWSFTALPGGKDKEPQLAGGPNNLIYLPLPYALYALDTDGHAVWNFSPWDNSDRFTIKTSIKRSFMDCAADEQTFFAVYADEKAAYKLVAIDSRGNLLWTYWMGDLVGVSILPGDQGRVYVTATLKPSKRQGGGKSSSGKLNQGRIYCFDRNSGKKPLWQYNVKVSDCLTEPVLSGGMLYVIGGSNIYRLDADTGILKYENRLSNLVSVPAIDENNKRVYAGSSKGFLYAIGSNGRLDWSRELEGAIEQAPLLGTDGYIYVCTQKGNLYKIRDNAAGVSAAPNQ